ncbi:hypothetical protein KFK09_021693 [Dendrobium nobile]|uniref:Uncharacterized protein n=1 Tax=Dendrobium nobile TaxID=94219 RepID=A0A8T3AI07_DENNO|nr:hypothetical protein KFK09_021693 [Dendrobium nobile]
MPQCFSFSSFENHRMMPTICMANGGASPLLFSLISTLKTRHYWSVLMYYFILFTQINSLTRPQGGSNSYIMIVVLLKYVVLRSQAINVMGIDGDLQKYSLLRAMSKIFANNI